MREREAVDECTVYDVRRSAQELFPGRSPYELMQRLRPLLCPLDVVIRQVPVAARVLDVGCGGGLLLGLLALDGRLVEGHGVDLSPGAIATARAMAQRLTGSHVELRFEQVTSNGTWSAAQYDTVCMIDLIHHVPASSQRSMFMRAATMVAEGGVLVYKDMCVRPQWRAFANRIHDLVVAGQWIRHLPIARVEQWASDAGLTMRRAERINRLWYGHDLRVFVRADRVGLVTND